MGGVGGVFDSGMHFSRSKNALLLNWNGKSYVSVRQTVDQLLHFQASESFETTNVLNVILNIHQEEDEAVHSRKTSVDDLESGLHNVDLNSTSDQHEEQEEVQDLQGCDHDSLDGEQVT